jgi:nucleotidyltransferase/DNA polymerase involved in DNA repair
MDLEHVHGVGPKLAERLRSVGVHSSEELATKKPREVLSAVRGVAGTNEQHVKAWIADARRLSAGTAEADAERRRRATRTRPQSGARADGQLTDLFSPRRRTPSRAAAAELDPVARDLPTGGPPRHESFQIRLEVDDTQHSVDRIALSHIRSGIERQRAGWSTTWLISAIEDTGKVHLGRSDDREPMTADSTAGRAGAPPTHGNPLDAERKASMATDSLSDSRGGASTWERVGHLVGGRTSPQRVMTDGQRSLERLKDGAAVAIRCQSLSAARDVVLTGYAESVDHKMVIVVDGSNLEQSVYRISVRLPL